MVFGLTIDTRVQHEQSSISMQELMRKRAIAIGLRARVPLIARLVAFALLVSGIAVVGVSYYKLRNVEKFQSAKSAKPELSKEVTGRRRRIRTARHKRRPALPARQSLARHHFLRRPSRTRKREHARSIQPKATFPIRSPPRARSTIRTQTSFRLSGNVKIDTKEKLQVATESLSFDQNSGVAQTDAAVTFNRENVSRQRRPARSSNKKQNGSN